ncbi:hypothetical protein [Streptomyces sp. WAC01280]|uniref:hypothetical protein n=1 Tax=Streptomyces sp. WAC01280 TaxID=2487424 RepID=UPI000F7A4AD8|nr:hypothetical protein [Streptomyces sp. WAC01280]RSS59547.1 hypothetical protein EF909_06630 [Streptomyces sp. WAC01280]
MIRPTLTADGTAVRLAVTLAVSPLLDELALAFADDPKQMGRLLAAHAASVAALDFAVVSDDTPDWERAMRAAEADGTRDALLGGLESAERLDDVLDPDDAISLATALTKLAAHIRNTRKEHTP